MTTVPVERPETRHVGNGVLTTFAIGFILPAADHLQVRVNGQVRTLGVDYTIVATNVVFVTAPANGAAIDFQRRTPVRQATEFPAQPSMTPKAVEAAFNERARVDQDQQARLDRALLAPLGETLAELPKAADRAKAVAYWAMGALTAFAGQPGYVLGWSPANELTNLPPAAVAVNADAVPSLTAALSLSFDAPPLYLRTAGYLQPGDGGHALYVRRDAAPVGHEAWFPCSGKFYELADDWVNIRVLGARAVPGVDNAAAIQKALTAAGVLKRPCIVPPAFNKFEFASAVTLPDGVTLIGSGDNSWLKQVTPHANGLILGNDCTVEKIRLELARPGTAPPDAQSGNAVHAIGKRRIALVRCRIHGHNGHGIYMAGCSDKRIQDNLFYAGYWTFTPTQTPGATSCDIGHYTFGTPTGRLIMTGNMMYSNNSHGFMGDVGGADRDHVIDNNIAVTLLDDLSGLVPRAALMRRHGMITGYGSTVEMESRLTVSNFLAGNTLISGVTLAGWASGGARANCGVTVSNVTCWRTGNPSLPGDGPPTDGVDRSLCGGIVVLGGGEGDLITNCHVLDFQGLAAAASGAFVVIHYAFGGVTLSGCRALRSRAYALVIKGEKIGRVAVRDFYAKGCVGGDVLIQSDVPATAAHGPVSIEDSYFAAPAISEAAPARPSVVVSQWGTEAALDIEDNEIIGGGQLAATTADNCLVRIYGQVQASIRRNRLSRAHIGVRGEVAIEDRVIYRLRIDNNVFSDVTYPKDFLSETGTGTMVTEDNRYAGHSAKNWNRGGSGHAASYEGRRIGDQLELYVDAAPTRGTFVVGDRMTRNGAVIGEPMHWYITTAGSRTAGGTGGFVATAGPNL